MNEQNKISIDILKIKNKDRNKNNSLKLTNIQTIDPKWYKISYEDYKSGNFNEFNKNKIVENSKLKKIESSLNFISNKKNY